MRWPMRRTSRGSSPLARGLLVLSRDDFGEPGIIPARAGFTLPPVGVGDGVAGSSPLARGLRGRPPAGGGGPGDHPRSRGVYCPRRRRSSGSSGSSPLARGLLDLVVLMRPDAGIIPARAGFTDGDHRAHHRHGDHPRSRGVYQREDFQGQVPGGSSPLARGLRRFRRHRLLQQRIIPARAGFTDPLTRKLWRG